jgi:glycosyltransferase involved in cell wall biosynthesis
MNNHLVNILTLLCLSLFFEYSDPSFVNSHYNLTLNDVFPDKGELQNLHKVGLFTDNGLSPGGGESYFLSAALTFYNMGFDVEIIIWEDNICKTVQCLGNTLKSLRIPLAPEDVLIRTIQQTTDLYEGRLNYDVFFIMGNNKNPIVGSIGKYNIFMCQFPFDLYLPRKDYLMRLWSKYDLIIVNSRFTYDWYIRCISRETVRFLRTHHDIPTLAVLHPPVQAFAILDKHELEIQTQSHNLYQELKRKSKFSPLNDLELSMKAQSSAKLSYKTSQQKYFPVPPRSQVTNIIVMGRFFTGRQNKGHDIALEMFRKVTKSTNLPLHLHLIGFVHPDKMSRQYVNDLRFNATKYNINVSLYENAQSNTIGTLLRETTILWHLTGVSYLGNPTEDPASFEHFGIAIVEALFSGLIPIVTNLGGTTDIITHDYNGFLAEVASDYIKYTLHILSLTEGEVEAMRKRAMKSACQFGLDFFEKNLESLIIEGILRKPLKTISKRRTDEMKALSHFENLSKSKYVAVIIEPGINSLLEIVIRNALHYLGAGWVIQVQHTITNDNILRAQLKGLRVQYVVLPTTVNTREEYDQYLKTPEFWSKFRKDTKVLLLSCDTVLLRSGIEEYLKYDFVSAPINVNYVLNKKLSNKTFPKEKYYYSEKIYPPEIIAQGGMGIGKGLSLRSAGHMYRIANHYSNVSLPTELESVFFLKHAQESGFGFSVAPRQISYSFSWEVDCPDLIPLEKPPFGISSAWMYMHPTIINGLIERNVPNTVDKVITKFPPSSEELIDILSKVITKPEKEEKHFMPSAKEMNSFDFELNEERDIPVEKSNRNIENKNYEDSIVEKEVVHKKHNNNEFHKPMVANTVDIRKAYSFLKNPSFLIDGNDKNINKLLDELGVFSDSDLLNCENTHIDSISELLKPIARKKFHILLKRSSNNIRN